MKATINCDKANDVVVIVIDDALEAWYSAENNVLHIVDIDSGFALISRKGIRDIDHARAVVASSL